MNLRKLHRQIAPILLLPLFLSAITGIFYRLGRSWFGISKDFAEFMMVIHQGEYLGRPLVPIYVLLLGLGVLGLSVTGFSMLNIKRQLEPSSTRRKLRWVHHCVAAFAFLPLMVSAVTGVAFRLGQAWFKFPSQWRSLLLRIHQGSYLGQHLKVFYVLLLGLSLIILLGTGLQMMGLLRRSRPTI